MYRWLSPAFGTTFCAFAAGLSSWALSGNSRAVAYLPLVFIVIIGFSAIRFGRMAGLLGTMLAAGIFAAFLFEPTLSFKVNDPVQRNNLIWMILGGLAISELLGKIKDFPTA